MFKILVRNKDSEIKVVGWKENNDVFAINITGITVKDTTLLENLISKGTPIDDFLSASGLESLITTEVGSYERLPLKDCVSFADVKAEIIKHPDGLYLVLLEN